VNRKTKQKKARKAMIIARLDNALADMYHNASLHFPTPSARLKELIGKNGAGDFAEGWLQGYAENELEYLTDGGPRLSEKRARKYAAEKYPGDSFLAEKKRQKWVIHCTRDESPEDACYDRPFRILDYGKLYQWGRGGATLAPDSLIRTHGGSSFSIKKSDHLDGDGINRIVDTILILEAFNAYVNLVCSKKAVQDCYNEAESEKIVELEEERKELAHNLTL
jgi:hypothetical protein